MPAPHALAPLAERFRQLHLTPTLVLPNAWDTGSARLLEAAGCAAIASTSSGVAWAHGVADGQNLSRDQMLEAVGRIAAAVALPVTADMEAGYADTPKGVADTVRALIQAGAVGLNLEDAPGENGESLRPVDTQRAILTAAREAAQAEGVPVIINARTDIYLKQVGDPTTRFERTVERLNAYRAVGAGCLFAPGVRDPATIGRLVQQVDGPLNILAKPGSPTVPELRALGVARVSVGGAIALAALGLLQRAARELLNEGTYEALETDLTFQEVQDAMSAR